LKPLKRLENIFGLKRHFVEQEFAIL